MGKRIKQLCRAFLSGLSILTSYPVAAILALLAVILDNSGRYVDVANLLAYVPFRWGERTRYFFYSMTIESLGKGCVFKYGSLCHYRKTKIGNNVLVGFYTVLGEIIIGNDVLIGSHVLFLSGNKQHGFSDPEKKIAEHVGQRIQLKIGNDIWIGSRSVVMADIGNRCVVAAGSVVIKPVTDKTIVGGNPANCIKELG